MVLKQDFWYWPAEENRTLHIYLPDDYDYTNERYPVTYFFDGHNLFFDWDATFGKSWGLNEFMNQWSKKMIIVGMECAHTRNDRLREYCPYQKRMFGETINGIGDETMRWIEYDVKPYIDQNFRTYGHREATAIAGSSMGGIMSMYAIMRYNHIFSKAACVSTGIFHNLSSFRKDLKQSSIHPDTRIYMSWGELESGKAAYGGNPEFDTRESRGTRKFERELQEAGAMTYLYFQWGGRPCEADWEKQLPIFMNWLWF